MRLSLKVLRDLSFAALAVCAASGGPASAKTFVYVSNAQDGNIDAYVLEKSSGALTPIGKAEAGKLVMPMAVSPSKKLLYAVMRSDPFRVATYAINPETGALTQRATAPLPDSMPYVSVDATGRFLFTASYGGDKIAVSPISESGLVEAAAIQVIATGRNAHAILADRTNKFVYVPTLGANEVLQFRFDAKSGKLTPNEPAAVKDGLHRRLPHPRLPHPRLPHPRLQRNPLLPRGARSSRSRTGVATAHRASRPAGARRTTSS